LIYREPINILNFYGIIVDLWKYNENTFIVLSLNLFFGPIVNNILIGITITCTKQLENMFEKIWVNVLNMA